MLATTGKRVGVEFSWSAKAEEFRVCIEISGEHDFLTDNDRLFWHGRPNRRGQLIGSFQQDGIG